jgi:hypothetical protein
MFLRKFLSNNNFVKFRFSLSSQILRNFSGSHGHGSHGHDNEEPPSHNPFYDRVSYNKKLKSGEREP